MLAGDAVGEGAVEGSSGDGDSPVGADPAARVHAITMTAAKTSKIAKRRGIDPPQSSALSCPFPVPCQDAGRWLVVAADAQDDAV